MTQTPSQPDPAQSARKVELIIAQLDSLPTLPRIASQLLRLTRSDQSTTRQIIELIKQDQALTARILSLARRAGSGIRGEATTIDKCVLLMGLEAVRATALSIKIFEIFDPADDRPAGAFSLAEFWKHSLAVALSAERLVAMMPKTSPAGPRPAPDELFVAGLLHDIGKAALHHCLPKSYAKVVEAAEATHAPLLSLERRLIGIDHSVVGKRLAQRWGLAQGVIDVVWLHHQPRGAMPQSVLARGFAPVVHLADLLVRELRLGYSGNYNRLADSVSVAAPLGIDSKRLDEVRRWLPNELANRATLIGMDQLDSRDLYHEALKGANEELARLNEKLIGRSASLSTKAKYFDLLGELSRRLRPGGRAMEVAEVIARLLAPVIGASRVVVFSEPPADSPGPQADPPIEGVVLVAENGPPAEKGAAGYFPDRPEGQPAQDASESVSAVRRFILSPRDNEIDGLAAARRGGWFEPSQSADAFAVFALEGHLGWVHSQLPTPLPLEHARLMPLLAEGRWVGGLVFCAAPDSGFLATWAAHRDELLAVASAAGLALRTAQVTAAAEQTAEELAVSAEICARLQDQIIRQKALASVGLMAAGAGHELNNPLMVISGRSELLAAEEPDPARREALEQIRANAQRASGIITELMDFAQPPAAHPQTVDLLAFVRGLAEPLGQSGIHVELTGEPDLPPAWADPGQLREVVQEVLDNAQQAMAAQDTNRRLRLRLARSPLEGGPVQTATEAPSLLELTVADTGVGMDPFVLEHATDPFFSARPAGRSRGLGLARARRLIEHNGGSLSLDSSPGVGTTVRITVPATAPQPA